MIVIPQILSALLVGVSYYMLAMAMTVYDGLLSMIFQPIMGAICTVVAIIILLVVGLPIRLMKKVNQWWKDHWWIAFILGTLAFAMMFVSWMPLFRIKMFDPETGIQFDSFHPVFSIGGWMLTIFAVLHFYPPLPWLKTKNHNPEQVMDVNRP
jgi:hypothetical protein